MSYCSCKPVHAIKRVLETVKKHDRARSSKEMVRGIPLSVCVVSLLKIKIYLKASISVNVLWRTYVSYVAGIWKILIMFLLLFYVFKTIFVIKLAVSVLLSCYGLSTYMFTIVVMTCTCLIRYVTIFLIMHSKVSPYTYYDMLFK